MLFFYTPLGTSHTCTPIQLSAQQLPIGCHFRSRRVLFHYAQILGNFAAGCCVLMVGDPPCKRKNAGGTVSRAPGIFRLSLN